MLLYNAHRQAAGLNLTKCSIGDDFETIGHSTRAVRRSRSSTSRLSRRRRRHQPEDRGFRLRLRCLQRQALVYVDAARAEGLFGPGINHSVCISPLESPIGTSPDTVTLMDLLAQRKDADVVCLWF